MAAELLSICIPTYNRAPLLKEILQTFIDQMRKDGVSPGDVILYVSDNTSTDQTPQVVEGFQKQGVPLVYSRNPANLGISRNLTKVIGMGKGRFIWTVGDDEMISPKALANMLKVLRQHDPGLLLAFDTRYTLKLPAPQLFPDYQAFARECIRLKNAHPLAEQTLLSSNIFRSDYYDPAFAEENIDTFFPHMFGMLRPLLKKRAPVLLPDFPIITVRKEDRSVPKDGVWANLDACWAGYLGWLRDEMQMPELDPHAPSRAARRAMLSSMVSDPIGYFKKYWRALFQPSAYRFLITRLFGLRK